MFLLFSIPPFPVSFSSLSQVLIIIITITTINDHLYLPYDRQYHQHHHAGLEVRELLHATVVYYGRDTRLMAQAAAVLASRNTQRVALRMTRLARVRRAPALSAQAVEFTPGAALPHPATPCPCLATHKQ